MLARSWES